MHHFDPNTVTSENYADAAVCTECDYVPVLERIDEGRGDLAFVLQELMSESCQLGERQDLLKKKLFYGKDINIPYMYARGTHLPVVYERLKDPKVIRLVHAAIGLQTETSELQAALYDHIFEGKELDLTNIGEEGGDVTWYVGIINHVLGWPLTRMLRQNIAKLYKRFPNKFTEESANFRNLAAEREVLESYHDIKM